MMKTQFHLGASLYVPATREPENLVAIGNGKKFPQLRSVIFCTEDAVREDQVAQALRNLKQALPSLKKTERPMRFIRVRNPHVLGRCLATAGIENIDGFVLPKVTCTNLRQYQSFFASRDAFFLMPTLETAEVFDAREMTRLRELLQKDSNFRSRVLCLRIGGNDLLNCLRVRREPRHTIYDTPVGGLISRLAGEFIPHGFGLTAPVFEAMTRHDVLRQEIELDLLHGLIGKTAIHPDQIQVIEEQFAVEQQDLEEAEQILNPGAPAVFRMGDRMCEPTTHAHWARDILTRAEIYGVRGSVVPLRRAQ